MFVVFQKLTSAGMHFGSVFVIVEASQKPRQITFAAAIRFLVGAFGEKGYLRLA